MAAGQPLDGEYGSTVRNTIGGPTARHAGAVGLAAQGAQETPGHGAVSAARSRNGQGAGGHVRG